MELKIELKIVPYKYDSYIIDITGYTSIIKSYNILTNYIEDNNSSIIIDNYNVCSFFKIYLTNDINTSIYLGVSLSDLESYKTYFNLVQFLYSEIVKDVKKYKYIPFDINLHSKDDRESWCLTDNKILIRNNEKL